MPMLRFPSPPRKERIPPQDLDLGIDVVVSSHLPARGGSCRIAAQRAARACFQSPPREGRILPLGGSKRPGIVSSHLPARGGSIITHGQKSFLQVSSHLPARGGSWCAVTVFQTIGGFQSPPRERRIPCGAYTIAEFSSFQSPPREGRIAVRVLVMPRRERVSSHLPARGGSQQYGVHMMDGSKFPVTSPRGEDPRYRYLVGHLVGVSSHLPARGGSGSRFPFEEHIQSFQSPPREGRISCLDCS